MTCRRVRDIPARSYIVACALLLRVAARRDSAGGAPPCTAYLVSTLWHLLGPAARAPSARWRACGTHRQSVLLSSACTPSSERGWWRSSLSAPRGWRFCRAEGRQRHTPRAPHAVLRTVRPGTLRRRERGCDWCAAAHPHPESSAAAVAHPALCRVPARANQLLWDVLLRGQGPTARCQRSGGRTGHTVRLVRAAAAHRTALRGWGGAGLTAVPAVSAARALGLPPLPRPRQTRAACAQRC